MREKILQFLEKENHWRIQVRLFAENSKEKCNKRGEGKRRKFAFIHLTLCTRDCVGFL